MPAQTEPGKYTDWKGEIDELEIIQPFKIADFEKVVVMPFDISEVKLPFGRGHDVAMILNSF